jgi:nitroreductase
MADYTLSDYHERSKHRPNRYAPGPGRLDWSNQPNPFRGYAGAECIHLPLAADGLATRYSDLRQGQLPSPLALDLNSIGILFELSLAISAWKSAGDTSWALRCNPSSGNLHPTEGYLVSGHIPGLTAGVYHYASRDHALERRGVWDVPPELPGVFVGLTSIVWREAWKYGMRAFRYCQHDCGHAIAALGMAAAALGWRAHLLAAPSDVEIAALLGLDHAIGLAEREAPDCLLWIAPGDLAAPPLPPSPTQFFGTPNRLSAEQVHWPDIEHVDQLTAKPHCAPMPEPDADVAATPISAGLAGDIRAATLIRQRRSAVDFDATTHISAAKFFAILDATLPRTAVPPWSAWPWPAEVHLALFVHRVEGLEAGLYMLVRNPQALTALKAALRSDWLWQKAGPADLPLYLLVPHDLRDIARSISCGQDIAADSCYSLGMLAHYAITAGAPWRYRALYWECGLLGQVLYLEAEVAGIRGTGIGCFLDDEMHALLGLEGNAWQSLYHFTAGGAVDDPRLTLLPPYSATRTSSGKC